MGSPKFTEGTEIVLFDHFGCRRGICLNPYDIRDDELVYNVDLQIARLNNSTFRVQSKESEIFKLNELLRLIYL